MRGVRVLCVQELGMGLWHTRLLGALGEALTRRGADLVYAVSDPVLARHALGDSARVLVAPRHLPPAATEFNARSYGDILGATGWADPEVLGALTRSWRTLFELCRPDAVVVDHAPAALLAYGGLVPIVHVGMGFTLPPVGLEAFPALQDVAASFEPQRLLENALAARQRPLASAPGRLPEVLRAERAFVTCLPELDPYRSWRSGEVQVGPIPAPEARPEGGAHQRAVGSAVGREERRFFAYLADDDPRSEGLLAALSGHGCVGRAWLRGDGPATTGPTPAGLERLRRPARIAEALASAGFVVHHGGIGIAQEAAAAGVPQLIVPRHLEQAMNGARLERLGLGVVLGAGPSPRDVGEALARLGSEVMARRVRDYAAIVDARAEDDPTGLVAEATLALAKGQRPG